MLLLLKACVVPRESWGTTAADLPPRIPAFAGMAEQRWNPVLIGASWSLRPRLFGAAVVFILAHAAYEAVTAHANLKFRGWGNGAGGTASPARPALSLGDGGSGADPAGYGIATDPGVGVRVGDGALNSWFGDGDAGRLSHPARRRLAGFAGDGCRLLRRGNGWRAETGAALRSVLAQEAITSQLVDNINASIHLRALLRGGEIMPSRCGSV
jgi:hypothetical protein